MHRSSVAAVALLVSCSSLASAAVVQVSALAGPSCTAVLSSSTVQASLAGAPIQCLPGTVSISAAASAAAAAVASAAVDAAAAQHPSSSFYVLSPTNQTLDAFACPSVACAQPAACTKVFTASQADPQTGPQSGEQAGQQASCPLSFQFLDDSTTSKLPVNIIGRTSLTNTTVSSVFGVIAFIFVCSFISWFSVKEKLCCKSCRDDDTEELPKTTQDINNRAKHAGTSTHVNARQPQAQAAPQTSEVAIAMSQPPPVPEKDLPKAPKSGKKTVKKAAGTRTTKKKSKAVVDDDAAAEEEVEDVAPAATPKRKAKPVVQKDEPAAEIAPTTTPRRKTKPAVQVHDAVEEEVEYVAPAATPKRKTKPVVQMDEPAEEIATPKPIKTAKAAPRAAPAASAVPTISSPALSKPAPVIVSSRFAAAAAEPEHAPAPAPAPAPSPVPVPVRFTPVRIQPASQPASIPAPVSSRADEPQPQPTRARRAAVQVPVDDSDDDDDDDIVPARSGYYDEFGLFGAAESAASAGGKPVATQPKERI